MSLLDRIFKAVPDTEEERRKHFERNKNKKILASTTMPKPQEVKQEAAEKGE